MGSIDGRGLWEALTGGHGFSRAVSTLLEDWASAPAGPGRHGLPGTRSPTEAAIT